MIQRIRYAVRYHSTYWLLYGFAQKPTQYAVMLERVKVKEPVEALPVSLIAYEGYYKCNPKNKSADAKINSFGFRGKEFSLEKAVGVYRIVVMGGSTTYGIGADDSHTYPVILEKYLNNNSAGRFEVINAGIPEAGINNIYALFKKEIVPLKPDMVIINSIANNMMASDVAYQFDLMQKINHFFLSKSLFYMTLREKIRVTANRPIVEIYRASFNTMLDNFLKNKKFYSELKKNYEEIIEEAKQNAIRTVIVCEPAWLRDCDKDHCGIILDRKFAPVWKKIYLLLDEIGEEEGITVVNSERCFDAVPESDKRALFTDGLHLTTSGNELLAHAIFTEVFQHPEINNPRKQ